MAWFQKKKQIENDNSITPQVVTPDPNSGGASFTTGPQQSTPTLNINVTTDSKNFAPAPAPATEPKKKQTGKKVFGIVSLSIAILSLAVMVYAFVDLGTNGLSSGDGEGSYLRFNGKSEGETRTLLSSFGTGEEGKTNKETLRDVRALGSKVFFSSCKITPNNVVTPDLGSWFGQDCTDFSLYDVNGVITSTSIRTNSSEKQFFIDFNFVPAGSYLLYPTGEMTSGALSPKDIYPVSLSGKQSLDYSFVTLPDKEKNRKRVTIRNNKTSPYTMIEVFPAGSSLASGNYDFVLYPAEYSLAEGKEDAVVYTEATADKVSYLRKVADSINDTGLYKVAVASNLEEANLYQTNQAYAVSDKLSDTVSLFLKTGVYSSYQTYVLPSSSSLPGYDLLPEIRELSGGLEMEGEGYSGVIGNNLLPQNKTIYGKESFVLQDGYTASADLALRILGILENEKL